MNLRKSYWDVLHYCLSTTEHLSPSPAPTEGRGSIPLRAAVRSPNLGTPGSPGGVFGRAVSAQPALPRWEALLPAGQADTQFFGFFSVYWAGDFFFFFFIIFMSNSGAEKVFCLILGESAVTPQTCLGSLTRNKPPHENTSSAAEKPQTGNPSSLYFKVYGRLNPCTCSLKQAVRTHFLHLRGGRCVCPSWGRFAAVEGAAGPDSALSRRWQFPVATASRGPAAVALRCPRPHPCLARRSSRPSGETSSWVGFAEELGGNSLGTFLTRGTEKARVMARHAPMCDLQPGNRHPPWLSHWKHVCLSGPVWASLSLWPPIGLRQGTLQCGAEQHTLTFAPSLPGLATLTVSKFSNSWRRNVSCDTSNVNVAEIPRV